MTFAFSRGCGRRRIIPLNSMKISLPATACLLSIITRGFVAAVEVKKEGE